MLVGIVGIEAEPTEFMLALPAHHVLAPTVLLDQDTALGARLLKEQPVEGAELLRIQRENFF
jgi:hypothetical protein